MADFKVWPWRPKITLSEGMEWKTDVIGATDGSEQRISVRDLPRQSFDVEVVSDQLVDIATLRLAVSYGQGKLWGWPCWHEQQRLVAPVALGAVSIPIDTTAADFRAGGHAIIWSAPASFEVIEVNEVTDTALTLAEGTSSAHEAGAFIMPLRLAYISESVDIEEGLQRKTALGLVVSCTDSVDLSGPASVMQYLAQDVLSEIQLMPAESRKRTLNRTIWRFDPVAGPLSILAPGLYPVATVEHRWRLTSPERIWAFRQWLHRRLGRCVPVWIPSWRHDFVLAAGVSSTVATITVQDTNWRTYGADQPTKKHVALIKADNTFVCRGIVSAAAGTVDGQEVLTLDSAPGISAVVKVSFISLYRFAADRIELAWKRPGVAEVVASMVEVSA